MGADHARTLSSAVAGARLAAVADVEGERAREAAGGDAVAAYSDAFALVADAGVDAVVVASSDATHEDYVLACLAAGKPVLCEKPLAPTVAACRRGVDAGGAGGRRLVSVGFMRRYDPGYLQAKQLVADGELGAVLLVHHVHRNVSQPPGVPSEVLVTGSAVHEIDVTRWLLGEEIVAVTARLPRRSSLVTGDTRDPQFLVLETASGVVVDIEVFANAHYGYDVRCELVCERGALTVGGPRPLDVRLDQRD